MSSKRSRSTIAIVVGAVGVSCFLGLVGMAFKLSADEAARERAARKPVEEPPPPEFDDKIACELATAYLQKKNFDSVECLGIFKPGPIAKLQEVKGKHSDGTPGERMTFCFTRAHRWFVLSTPPNGLCPTEEPDLPPGTPATEQELEREEEALRQAETNRRAKEEVESFVVTLSTVRALLGNPEIHTEKKCPVFRDAVTASYADFDALPGLKKPGVEAWPMLTDRNVRDVLDAKASWGVREAAMDQMRQKSTYLAVFHGSTAKNLPKKTDGFLEGRFKGWVSVIDLATSGVVCDGLLEFQNGESVGRQAAHAVDEDLEKHFTVAVKKSLAEMSDQLSLGF